MLETIVRYGLRSSDSLEAAFLQQAAAAKSGQASFEESRATALITMVVLVMSTIRRRRWRWRRRVVRVLTLIEVALVPWWRLVRCGVRPLWWRVHTMRGWMTLRRRVHTMGGWVTLRRRVHTRWRWVWVWLRLRIPCSGTQKNRSSINLAEIYGFKPSTSAIQRKSCFYFREYREISVHGRTSSQS